MLAIVQLFAFVVFVITVLVAAVRILLYLRTGSGSGY